MFVYFRSFGASSADDGVSFRLFRALYSHKARCLNQMKARVILKLYYNIPYIPRFKIFNIFRVLEYSVYSVF